MSHYPGSAYRGNAGNLLQHYTLSQMLRVADENDVPGLNFIDAHAMAPWATVCSNQDGEPDDKFSAVRNRVTGEQDNLCVYELAWRRIINRRRERGQALEGYPSSAAFIREIWERDYSLLLCEKNRTTAAAIRRWLVEVGSDPDLSFVGDWRDRFETDLPRPDQVCLPPDSLTLVSFDPYKYDRRSGEKVSKGDLYPEDIVRVVRALRNVTSGILLQISTYSTGPEGQNSQEAVIRSLDAILSLHDFKKAAVVKENDSMMSLVYERGVTWATDLSDLPENFERWRRP